MPDSNPLQAGQKVGAGRFTLVKPLGRGGMGEVWLAQDERLNEPVALKFLPPEVRADPVALDDLRRETARSHKLSHPNIVRIHDLHEDPDGTAFIVMEYIDGSTLAGLRLQQPAGVLSWEYLRPLVEQLCAALEYAHGEKIIHRDLKPANIMVDAKGRLKLADFGIAAVVSDSLSRVSLRHSTSGTLPYMSPQQLTGKRPQATDDIYALGATLYELLTSKPPFYAGDLTHQVLHEPPEPMDERLATLGIQNEIPGDVGALIMACLAKEPEQRPPSAGAVAGWIGLEIVDKPSLQAMSDAVSPSPAQPAEAEWAAQTTGSSGRKLAWAGAALASLILLALGGWFWVQHAQKEKASLIQAKSRLPTINPSYALPVSPGAMANPFFAMDTATRDATHQTIESQISLIHDLGFAGFGPTFADSQGVREMFASLDQFHLKMFALFTTANLDAGKGAVTPQLKEAIQALKGRDTILWLSVRSQKYQPSSTEGDAAVVMALRELSRLAGEAGIRIALYPHAKNWVERVDDAVRLADKVGSNNLGVTFNLCHWLQVDGRDLEATLRMAMPRLFVVTINGADAGGIGWAQLIQPLDSGTFDVSKVLQTLMELDYTGPIGLQHYGMGGSAEENLKHSMGGWRKLSARAITQAFKPSTDALAAPEDGFISLFNGHDLSGWDGDPRFWSVQDNTIKGQTTPGNIPENGNTYLIWTNGTVSDFELRLSYKLVDGDTGSGILYRGRSTSDWGAQGYHADFWPVASGRSGLLAYEAPGGGGRPGFGMLAAPGEIVVWGADGKKRVVGATSESAAEIQANIKEDDWNEYVITAKGSHLFHRINGNITMALTDNDVQRRFLSGLLGLKVRPNKGKPMLVYFKDIRLMWLTKGAAVSDSPESTGPGWVHLFNGKTLSGWFAPDPGDWRVGADGSIISEGPDSYLISPGTYTNLEFKAEIQLSGGANGGMFFRTTAGRGNVKGYEAQANADNDPRRTGSLYRFKDIYEKLVPDNVWFTQHVIAVGNRIVIKLDNRIVVDYEDPVMTYQSGHLALQHLRPGKRLMYRNVMVKPLPADDAVAWAEARKDVPDLAR